MKKITQNHDKKQELFSHLINGLPIVLFDSTDILYFLVANLSDEMEEFLQAGKIEDRAIHVFSETEERNLVKYWKELGLKSKFCRQTMLYMEKKVEIVYLQVRNPETGFRVSLIPWFLLPNRLYPVFSYYYAIEHYNMSEVKSMRLSAAATAEIFGMPEFNKSTLCRNIKAMDKILNKIQTSDPIEEADEKAVSAGDGIGRVAELLKTCLSIEGFIEAWGDGVAKLPDPVNGNTEDLKGASGIPPESSNIVKNNPGEAGKPGNTRGSPLRRCEKWKRPKKKRIVLMDCASRERIRINFINNCKGAVFDMAAMYHRFII